jgi:RNA polymerase sigma-70 factor (ECF subfamily)
VDTYPQESPETLALLERLGTGEAEQAWGQLLGQHRDELWHQVDLRLDRRLRRRVDPSDVVQEAQLEATRRLPDYLARRPMPFRLWLRKLARERLIMAHRQHAGAACRAVARDVPLLVSSSADPGQPVPAPGSSPSQGLRRQELVGRVREAVAELSEADREMVLMRNLEQLTNQQAAAVLGIDPATASQRYGRALLRLRTILAGLGVTGSQP